MKQNVAAQVITGNPISFYAYIHNFFTKWYHLVDKLYVQIDVEPTSIVSLFPSSKDLFYQICKNDPKIVIKEVSNHKVDLKSYYTEDDGYSNFTGACMRHVVETCDEDIIFFTHDDMYITNPSILENHINLIKSGERDCIVVSASSLSEKYMELYKNKNPWLLPKITEFLCNDYRNHIGLNTSYFIAKKDDLLKTKLNFDGANYPIGSKPNSIDYISTPSDGTLYMEHGIDVLLQLYNTGKTNPLVFCADDTTHLLDLRMFRTEELFDDLMIRMTKYGHVHFSSSSIIKYWFQDNFKHKIDCEIDPASNSEHYYYIIRHERTLTEYIGIRHLIDIEKYPDFADFIKIYDDRINSIVEYINEKYKNINLDMNLYNQNYKDILYNNVFPYQIDLSKLPINKIKRFIDHV